MQLTWPSGFIAGFTLVLRLMRQGDHWLRGA